MLKVNIGVVKSKGGTKLKTKKKRVSTCPFVVFFPASDSAVCLVVVVVVVVVWPFAPVLLLLILVEITDAGGCSQRVVGHKKRTTNPFPLFLSFLLCQLRLHFVGLFSQNSFFDSNSLPGKLVYT